ncbi:uncharacterized protein LOC142236145 [Haematobia irritans]|uniref:Putative secreted protein n=1 Tax=Haematobia irritans TaxID=7368 RepID=A0A1L8EIB1_HAEIR
MLKLVYFTLILAVISVITIAAPYQELPPRAGHVPVYIRVGDTPLSEVNPKLVEAFHEEETPKLEEDKTPEVLVPDTNEEESQPKEDEKTNEEPIKDDIMKTDEVAKVDEVTASDIAEFDPIKMENEDDSDNEQINE